MNTYKQWLRRFLRFHRLRHPRERSPAEVNAFLTHLAVALQVSASTQNQALAALLFLYRDLLGQVLPLEGVIRARTRKRLPVVVTVIEVRAVLERLDGVEALIAGILYGGGLRLMERLRLRVHDLDFERWQITVRDGKGGKDRRTMFLSRLGKTMRLHLEEVKKLHHLDRAEGCDRVRLPNALA